ncbi:hypothetical protein BDD12DRAFT_863065 [Trichophaea hybrida]|nr:hypothetical protein BDD12DRAFT_863065 [Trichophaea hybrida]
MRNLCGKSKKNQKKNPCNHKPSTPKYYAIHHTRARTATNSAPAPMTTCRYSAMWKRRCVRSVPKTCSEKSSEVDPMDTVRVALIGWFSAGRPLGTARIAPRGCRMRNRWMSWILIQPLILPFGDRTYISIRVGATKDTTGIYNGSKLHGYV